MKYINDYITEKLHLTKDTKRVDLKFTHFVLVYSAKGMYPKKVKNWVKFFDSYNETIEFLESKEYKRKYVCGYCLTDEEYKRAYEIVYDGQSEATGILIRNFEWEKNLRQYAKENNLKDIYDYCK